MSNYLRGYFDVLYVGRPYTGKQMRRSYRKVMRDQIAGGHPGNPSRPKGLSGDPGRRRVQLEESAS